MAHASFSSPLSHFYCFFLTIMPLFSLHHHHYIAIVFPPPPPLYCHCFPSTTTTILPLSFLHHHHYIAIVFPPPPPLYCHCFPPPPLLSSLPHFHCFLTTTTVTFLLFFCRTGCLDGPCVLFFTIITFLLFFPPSPPPPPHFYFCQTD